mmetsp:Transcript_26927/g.81382  ORF Transcript_26927/g.81382 Transcript_26927/m.81382 type:complete len:81 (+) Transcript_26927:1-243(+)
MADSDAILFFSLAFSATVLQGYAHFFTRQKATMLQLQGIDDKKAKISFEWAHVVYFPCFVIHTMWDVSNGAAEAQEQKTR